MKIPSSWRWLGCSFLVIAALACSAAPKAQPTAAEAVPTPAPAGATEVPPAPALPSPTLAVPAGNQLAFALDATGVQIYACKASDGAFSWSLQGPEATLADKSGQVAIKHYAGPTWEWLADGSKVKAKKVAAFTEDAAAIPALLLEVSDHEGQGRMADVSFIQRLATRNGVAPSAGCDAAHGGELSRADYTATYYFYRTAH